MSTPLHCITRHTPPPGKVYCEACQFFQAHDICNHPHGRYVEDTPRWPVTHWIPASTRNAENACPDFVQCRNTLWRTLRYSHELHGLMPIWIAIGLMLVTLWLWR